MSSTPPTPSPSVPAGRVSHTRGQLWIVLGLSLLALWPLRHFSEQRRSELRLRPRTTQEAAGLWETVLTSGTGAFRAFANLAVWKQITDAEDNREYYRLIELYRTVLRLQPRNARAQRFLADQLIDTIAPRAAGPDAAWPWVREGMALLDTALERNPWSKRLHDALGVVYLRKMADYPVRILTLELDKHGAHTLLDREPEWRELARLTVADYHALPEADRDQLQHAIGRIGFSLIYSRNLSEFSEYTRLGFRAQAVYRRFNILRNLLSMLAYRRGIDPDFGVPDNDTPRLGRYAALRVDDVLAMRADFPDPDAAVLTIWRHTVEMYDAVRARELSGRFSQRTANRMLRHLRQVWADYPIPADTRVGTDAARMFSAVGSGNVGAEEGE